MSDGKSILGLISPEVQNKLYDDGLSGPVKVVSDITVDTLKALRLVLLPIQLMGMGQDRVVKWMAAIEAKVPPERQVPSPPEIAGPVLTNLRFTSDTNRLKDLYLNLLEASVDSDRQNAVHPGFIKVLERISATDAMVFWHIQAKESITCDSSRIHFGLYRRKVDVQYSRNKFINKLLQRRDSDAEQMILLSLRRLFGAFEQLKDEQLLMSLDVLGSESLISVTVPPIHVKPEVRPSLIPSLIEVTAFGKAFAAICLPGVFEVPTSTNVDAPA